MTRNAHKWLRFRLALLAVVFLVLFVGLLSRALQLQVISGSTLKTMAERQHTRNLVFPPERNMILDRNGQKLAVTIRVDSIYADPSRIGDPDRAAQLLSEALDIDKTAVRSMLSRRGHFSWIARRVSPEERHRVLDLGIEGVYAVHEPQRFYPHRDLACHVVGFVGLDATGLEGIELHFDHLLKSHPRQVLWGRDARGTSIYRAGGADGNVVLDDGSDLVLTIDARMQYIVELHVREAARRTGAKSGMAVVMDVRTGEVLALANVPSYNLNSFSKTSADVRRNRAVTDTFEPGSVFKPFVMAAALEEGVLSERDAIYCEDGSYTVGGRTIREAQLRKHGTLSPEEIIKYSSNIGMIKVADEVGKDALYQYITSFGFGSRTGIELPGEVGGILRRPGEWRAVDFATLSFGQGLSVTGIQLAAAMSAIANNGVLMKPSVVKARVDGNGAVIEEHRPTPVRQVISPLTAQRITSMLTSAVESDDGTGRAARISAVSVAGKTGTSQKFDWSRRQYSSQQVVTSFIGFFPADNPRLTVLVVLDEPRTDRWGGVAAAPLFREISEQIVTRFNHGIDIRPVAELPRSPDLSLLPAAAPAISQASVLSPDHAGADRFIPDFTGMSLREVLQAGRDLGIAIRVSGSGWAVRQETQMPSHSDRRPLCSVYFSTDIR